jgi:hypothetical protein
MSGCKHEEITDGAFVHLRGIHTLHMAGCSQRTITDGAFAHLRGIHTLNMSSCSQATITHTCLTNLDDAVCQRCHANERAAAVMRPLREFVHLSRGCCIS